MSDERAFPFDGEGFVGRDGHEVRFFGGHPGMSLRDWFAGQALAGLIANPDELDDPRLDTEAKIGAYIAGRAYGYADAMLAARSRQS